VQQTTDGGYIVAAYTSAGYDVYLIKTDGTGTEEWSKTLGGAGYECANSVQQTTDGGYILAGDTWSFGVGDEDVYLIKTDSTGTEVWSKTFGGASLERANSVQQTTDGGYIVAASTMSFGAGEADAWLIKTDSSGTEEWSKIFGGASYDWAKSVQQTTDGGYILAGIAGSFGAGDYDVWLIKTDDTGTEVWSKTFGGGESDYADSVQQTTDGGYIVAGSTESFGAGDYDVWLIKTDGTGTEEWSKTFGGDERDWAKSVQQTTDGGYILAGKTWSFGAGADDACLIKTDSSGTEEWSTTFGGGLSDGANSVQQTTDGGYIVAGYTVPGCESEVWLFYAATTVSAGLTCVPPSGTLPFTVQICAKAINNVEYPRTVAGKVDWVLANGEIVTDWKTGYAEIDPLGEYVRCFNYLVPYCGKLIGENVGTLYVADVTPPPFNQPPYPPSGDTDSDICTVVGVAP